MVSALIEYQMHKVGPHLRNEKFLFLLPYFDVFEQLLYHATAKFIVAHFNQVVNQLIENSTSHLIRS